jgi:glycosyltransferase involved in cell wall biosynthesis
MNEEEAISAVLKDVPWDAVDEVIVVDSSTDDTAQVAESLGARVIHEESRGYGRALQRGIDVAKGDIIVFIDGDYSYDPQDISRVVRPILSRECDVVVGNRLNGLMSKDSMQLPNKIGNLFISLIFRRLFGRMVKDTQCGLRAFRKKLLHELTCKADGMPYVTEQLIRLIRKGARIQTVEVSYRPRIGATKLRVWADGLRILRTMSKEIIPRVNT